MLSVCHLVSWVDRLSETVGKAISWMCLAIIAVMLYEIAARYFFNSPTSWAHEVTTMLYGTFCIMAGTYTHRYQGHVRSEALYHLFSRRGKAIVDTLTGSLVLFVLIMFLLRLWILPGTPGSVPKCLLAAPGHRLCILLKLYCHWLSDL